MPVGPLNCAAAPMPSCAPWLEPAKVETLPADGDGTGLGATEGASDGATLGEGAWPGLGAAEGLGAPAEGDGEAAAAMEGEAPAGAIECTGPVALDDGGGAFEGVVAACWV